MTKKIDSIAGGTLCFVEIAVVNALRRSWIEELRRLFRRLTVSDLADLHRVLGCSPAWRWAAPIFLSELHDQTSAAPATSAAKAS